MAGARFLSENFFDPTIFPDHTVSAEEEATSKEAWRVGTARRQQRDHWTPTTAASDTYIDVACDRVRYADMLVIDRGHNLTGQTVRLRASMQAAFGSYTEVAVTIPASVYYGSALENGEPVLTEEGAVIIPFAGMSAMYWRVFVDAGAAGYRPQIVGLFLGRSYEPSRNPPMPWDDEPRELVYDEILSPSLWAASSRKAQRRNGSVFFRVDDQEYTQARYHLHSLFWKGHVMWYVPDTDQAERSWLAVAPPGTYGAPWDGLTRTVTLAMVEHEPAGN